MLLLKEKNYEPASLEIRHHLFVFDMLITSLSLWFNFKCMIVFALILSLSLFRFCQTYKVAKTVSSHQIIWPIWFIELQTLSFTVAIGNMRHFPESLSVKKSLAKFGTRFCRDVKINHNFLKVNLHQVVNVEVSNFFHACTCPVDVWHEFAMENVNNYNVGTLFTFHQIAVLKNQSECFEDLLPGKLNLTYQAEKENFSEKIGITSVLPPSEDDEPLHLRKFCVGISWMTQPFPPNGNSPQGEFDWPIC